MHLMYLLAITAATESIDLQAAYFLPDPVMLRALREACQRGARVRLLVPDRYIDSRLIQLASKCQWGELLEAGVEIYQYERTMMHNKMLILDKRLVSVGSTNFDMRSFELNDEASLNIYSEAFAAQMTAVMESDLSHARRYTLAMLRERPWLQRFGEWCTWPIRSQL
jgi:cardiolipin synthase